MSHNCIYTLSKYKNYLNQTHHFVVLPILKLVRSISPNLRHSVTEIKKKPNDTILSLRDSLKNLKLKTMMTTDSEEMYSLLKL